MPGFLTKAQRLGPAALIMAGSVFLSRFMGLARDKVISYYYGAGPDTDIYFAAFVIPDFINYLLAGGYFSITLIPLMNRYFREDSRQGWRFFSAAFWWVVIAISALTLLAWIFAGPLAALSAPGLDAAAQERLASFMRIILPAQACFLPGACFTALLYMRRQFSVPALTPLIYNGCIIVVGVAFFHFFPGSGMEGFLWGVLCGAFLGSLALPFLTARSKSSGGVRLFLTLKHPGLRRFILLALPLMLGQSIVVLDEAFLRVFGSVGPEGAISLLNYARRIMMVPVGVVAQAAGVASFPFLASLAAAGDKAGFDQTLNSALRAALAVIIPLALWMMSAAEPIMRLIFEQGRFTGANTAVAAALLTIMLCAVPFWAVQQIVGRGFYANENTLTPVLVGSLATLLTLPLYFGLARAYGPYGVAWAGVFGLGLYAALLLWRWQKRYRGEALRGLAARAFQLAGLGLPGACLAWLLCSLIKKNLPGYPLGGAFISLTLSSLCFGLSYLWLCRYFAPRIWRETLEPLLSKFRR